MCVIHYTVGDESGSCNVYVPGRAEKEAVYIDFEDGVNLRAEWMEAKGNLCPLIADKENLKELRRWVEAGEEWMDDQREMIASAYLFIVLDEISHDFLTNDMKKRRIGMRPLPVPEDSSVLDSPLSIDSIILSPATDTLSPLGMSSPSSIESYSSTSPATADLSPVSEEDRISSDKDDEYDPEFPCEDDDFE